MKNNYFNVCAQLDESLPSYIAHCKNGTQPLRSSPRYQKKSLFLLYESDIYRTIFLLTHRATYLLSPLQPTSFLVSLMIAALPTLIVLACPPSQVLSLASSSSTNLFPSKKPMYLFFTSKAHLLSSLPLILQHLQHDPYCLVTP